MDSDFVLLYFEKVFSQRSFFLHQLDNCLRFCAQLREILKSQQKETVFENKIVPLYILFKASLSLLVDHSEEAEQALLRVEGGKAESLTQFIELNLSLVNEAFKELKAPLKGLQTDLREKMFVSILGEMEFFKTKENQRKTFALILNLARMLIEDKEFISSLPEGKPFFLKTIDFLKYYQEVLKVKKSKGVLMLLQILMKICRNLIFSKVSAKKQNLIADLVGMMEMFQDEETLLIDLLRILSKISEKEKISAKICSFPKIELVIKGVLQKHTKNNYVLSGILQLMANLLTFDIGYATNVYSTELINDLILLFERFTHSKEEQMNYEDMLKSFTSFEFLR